LPVGESVVEIAALPYGLGGKHFISGLTESFGGQVEEALSPEIFGLLTLPARPAFALTVTFVEITRTVSCVVEST
jgi:hypothetical protein